MNIMTSIRHPLPSLFSQQCLRISPAELNYRHVVVAGDPGWHSLAGMILNIRLLLFIISVLLVRGALGKLTAARSLKSLPGPKGCDDTFFLAASPSQVLRTLDELDANLCNLSGLPIIGSVLQLPAELTWIKFADWGREYGPIYQVNIAGHNHVWISSDSIAKKLMSKKAAIYSDRPHIPALAADNRSSAQYLPLLSRNDGWTRQRKFATHIMRQGEMANFYYYPEIESVRLLMELAFEKANVFDSLESYVSRITCRLAWGTSQPSDELKQRARELLHTVSPTGHLGNKLPFVMRLPSFMCPAAAWERRRVIDERRFFRNLQLVSKRRQRESLTTDTEPDPDHKAPAAKSWTDSFYDHTSQWDFASELEGAYAVGMHGIAGALTIAAPMQSFLLALIHHPHLQPALASELTSVCGDVRLPRESDRTSLPILRAFIRETLRWRPPVPTGIPHALTAPDIYDGHHIPAGSTIHALEWNISRDPELYPDPETFNPNRWLDPTFPTFRKPLTQFPTIRGSSQFGYGKRVCMGQAVADADLLVGLAALCWLFEVLPPLAPDRSKDDGGDCGDDVVVVENGEGSEQSSHPDPTLRFTRLLIAKPLPFGLRLRVRNKMRAEVVRREFGRLERKGEFREAEREWWWDD